jgi:hypothetical protein
MRVGTGHVDELGMKPALEARRPVMRLDTSPLAQIDPHSY